MSEGKTRLVISDDALAQAARIGVKGDLRVELAKMVDQSTPFSHELGNRRFDRFLLRVEQGTLVAVNWLDRDPIKERKLQRDAERFARRHRPAPEGDKGFIDLTAPEPQAGHEAVVTRKNRR